MYIFCIIYLYNLVGKMCYNIINKFNKGWWFYLFVKYNANPENKDVGDCTVRAISKLLNKEWQDIFIELMVQGLILCDMPSANHVWGNYLKSKGYARNVIPNSFPDDYSVEDFCKDNPKGNYLLALPSHVVAVKDGNFYDTWDSRNEIPLFYWEKREGKK